jgi:hypothetical protein
VTTVPMPDTRQAAIGIVCAAIKGDTDAIADALYSADGDGFGALIRASLNLFRALASRLRSAGGLLAVDVRLCEISREYYSRDTTVAAQLIVGHAQTCFPPDDDAETFAELHDLGADTFNAAIDEAGNRFEQVFAAAMLLWRSLLPEAETCMVGSAAAELWGTRSAEPEGMPMFRARTPAEDSPPQPTLAIPPEAEVAGGPAPWPYQVQVPPGAISLRGAAIRRLQLSGLW